MQHVSSMDKSSAKKGENTEVKMTLIYTEGFSKIGYAFFAFVVIYITLLSAAYVFMYKDVIPVLFNKSNSTINNVYDKQAGIEVEKYEVWFSVFINHWILLITNVILFYLRAKENNLQLRTPEKK